VNGARNILQRGLSTAEHAGTHTLGEIGPRAVSTCLSLYHNVVTGEFFNFLSFVTMGIFSTKLLAMMSRANGSL